MKKKYKKPKSSNEPQEKCLKCSRWITLDDYILNDGKCEDCGPDKSESNKTGCVGDSSGTKTS